MKHVIQLLLGLLWEVAEVIITAALYILIACVLLMLLLNAVLGGD
jgi:hypothetical protein